jgi:hypothetical protein
MVFSLSKLVLATEAIPGHENVRLKDRVPRFQKVIDRLFGLFWVRHVVCNLASKPPPVAG